MSFAESELYAGLGLKNQITLHRYKLPPFREVLNNHHHTGMQLRFSLHWYEFLLQRKEKWLQSGPEIELISQL